MLITVIRAMLTQISIRRITGKNRMLLLKQNTTFCLECELVSVLVSVLSANSSDNYGLCFHNTIGINSRGF